MNCSYKITTEKLAVVVRVVVAAVEPDSQGTSVDSKLPRLQSNLADWRRVELWINNILSIIYSYGVEVTKFLSFNWLAFYTMQLEYLMKRRLTNRCKHANDDDSIYHECIIFWRALKDYKSSSK